MTYAEQVGKKGTVYVNIPANTVISDSVQIGNQFYTAQSTVALTVGQTVIVNDSSLNVLIVALDTSAEQIQGQPVIVTVSNSTIAVTGAVTVTSGSVTFTNTTIAVTGTVAISNSTIAVTQSGTWTVAISGNVTFTNTTIAVTQSGTWTVAISGSVTINGAVTITSGTVTFTNTTIAVTGTVAISNSTIAVTQSGTWTVAISGNVTFTNTTIAVTQSGTWTVAISGSVTINGAVTITSGTVTFTNTTIAVTGTVAISNSTIAVTQSGTWTVAISGNVTFTNTTIAVTQSGTWTVAISGSVTINGAVTITSGTVTFTNTTIAVTGTVAISNSTISVTQSGAWTFTGSVTITSGAVTISTSSGTNIIIDLLQQNAYIERSSTLSNNGATATFISATSAHTYGKYFPRGCRGFLTNINVWCQDNNAAGGTITVYISPNPSLNAAASAIITVPVSQTPAFLTATFNIMWNYDSLFIWVVGTANMQVGYDTGTPYDAYTSTNSGLSWSTQSRRFWFQPTFHGETVSDVPVSGTVNNIPIPNTASGGSATDINIPNGTETSLVLVNGSGKITRISLWTSYTAMEFRFYIDGVMIPSDTLLADTIFSADMLNARGFTATTPQIQLQSYNSPNSAYIYLEIEFEFKKTFEVRAYQTSSTNYVAYCGVIANNIF